LNDAHRMRSTDCSAIPRAGAGMNVKVDRVAPGACAQLGL